MLAFVLTAAALAAPAATGLAAQAAPVLFSAADEGRFPEDWKERDDGAREVYAVRVEGGVPFLRAVAEKNSHTIGQEISVDPGESPRFSFAWRPVELPAGGDERSKSTNDSALGVYVIFEGWGVPPKSLKYVWSTTLPPGTTTESPYSSRAKVVVLRSGPPAEVGRWQEEVVDVAEDYRRLFGDRDVPKVKGIAVLTDADNTGTRAAGDYRSFVFGPRAADVR